MKEDPPPQSAYWTRTPPELFRQLDSRAEGLSGDEADQRLKQYGLNTIKARHKNNAAGLFLEQFKSPIILILLVATIISAILSDWVDAVIILVIVMGSAVLSFVQEYNAGVAAEKLLDKIAIRANVLRGGKTVSIPSEQVVPGDVVLLSAGSLIPGDGIVLEARELFVSQSVLTGETFPVEKTVGVCAENASLPERTNMVFMGTSVRSGKASVLIVQTGLSTVFGQIANKLKLRPPETEFERGIRHFGMLLTEVMLLLVLAIFFFNVFFQKPILDSLLFSIALAVGLTPQLLPAIININLSKGAQGMAKEGVIVRRLAAIENFGSMDVLCTDKTGTLTLGVVQLDGARDILGQESAEVLRLAYLNAYHQTGMANALDDAILHHPNIPDTSMFEKVDEIPYDFVRKRLSVIVRQAERCTMITKGALETILAVCTSLQSGTGEICALSQAEKDAIEKLYADWSGQGYRILGVASKEVEPKPVYGREEETGLIFEGFLLFFDPPKPGVQKTVQELSDLGVELKVITGDNQLVATHLANEIGLPVTGIITGAELNKIREEALWQRAQHTNLFVEVDPNQKERIIHALQRGGHVVGYMGDGVNDAPALHTADLGISVDSAVDVAKEAADFVLSHSGLDVLQRGIQSGRRTFANTLKYVFMATSANFGNMFSVAGASLFLPFLPMLPKQILLINFLTDLPEMTIASDNVDEAFVRTPHRWNIGFIRRFMFTFGLLSSVFDYLTFGALLLVLGASPEQFRSGWFIESVLSASLVVFAIRTRSAFQRSRPSRVMLLVTGLIALVTLLIPFTPLGTLLEFTPLPISYLALLLGIVVLYFFSAEALKRWFYRHVQI